MNSIIRTTITVLTVLFALVTVVSPVAAQSEKVCFPSCSEVDGRFLVIATGEALQTLADQPVRVKLAIPKGQESFELEIFDGDSGATDPEGNSHWDLLSNPVTYTLYADPNTDGTDLIELDTFTSEEMLDNDWFSIVMDTDEIAAADSGNFFYLLEITPGDQEVVAVNALKIRTTGFVFFGLLDQPFAFMATWTRTTSDLPLIYPNYNPLDPLSPSNLLGSNYDGSFTFYLDLQIQPGQSSVQEVAMWDGDLDRGDFDGINPDGDDANTPNDNLPFFDINDASVFEGVAVGTGLSTGAPPDNVDPASQGGFGIYNDRSPSVQYRVFSPTGDELALNTNPSGNREWEKFSVSTLPFDPSEMDVQAESLSAGTYKIVVEGMDMNNLNAWYFEGSVLCQRQNGEPCSELPRRYVVGDLVWEDPDRNGVPNPGEPGIPGVVMNLLAADGTVLAQDLTDVDGAYLFDVDPGDYTIEVAAQNFESAGPAGGVGDFVWLDLDADGVQDGNEPGIPNVNVLLIDPGVDGVPGSADDRLIEISQTDERGRYFFNSLTAGDYFTSVDESTLAAGLALSGGNDPSAVRTIATNEVFRDLDFGYSVSTPSLAAIGNYVYYDANNDGVQQGNEAGIGGVTVALMAPGPDGIFGTDDDIQVSSATTVGGHYLFSDLAPGDYQVEVTDISDVVADLLLTAAPGTLPVAAGDVNLAGDFGYFSSNLHSIADVVWFDTDRDGVLDADENGLSNVVVSLLNASGETTLSTTSAADGSFSFHGLPDGQYTIEIVDGNNVLAGLLPTTEAALIEEQLVIIAGADVSGINFGLVDEGALTGFDATTASPTQSNTVTDANVLTYDFGYAEATDAAIGDRVWFDNNGDGVQDAGEPGISGVRVRLLDSDGAEVDTVTTDGNGIYDFPPLAAGSYTVVIDPASLPVGVIQTFELDGSLNGRTTELLDPNEINLDVDFGYMPPVPMLGSIGDRVWLDEDGDGQQDPGESGISGVTVELKGENGEIIATDVTDSNGNYLFPNLPAGTYSVSVDPSTLPTGVDPTFDRDGTLDNETPITLGTGEDILDADFGYDSPDLGSIGDTIFEDENGNGVEDPNEPGIPGVTVTLKDENGNVIDSDVTDENGLYLFDNLDAGTYSVCVDPTTLPPGFEQTADPDGTFDDETTVDLGEGEDNLDADFGYMSTGCVAGEFLDEFEALRYDNNDGTLRYAADWVEGDETANGAGPNAGNIRVVSQGWLALRNRPESGEPSAARAADLSDFATAVLSFDFIVTSGADPEDLAVIEISTDGGATYEPLETLTGIVENEPVIDSREYDITNAISSDFLVRFRLSEGFGGFSERLFLDNVRIVVTCEEPGSIGDTIWQDDDRDGVQDIGEPGIPGVTVLLKDANGNVIDSQVTDADGMYLFQDLPAGTYTICVDPTTLPDGYVQTGDPDGTLDDETTIVLGEGENYLDGDFGYNAPPTGSIGDTIWQDVDRDGIEDADEPGIPGVTVLLKDVDGNVIDSQVTNADGMYLFEDLVAGTYTICVDPTTLPTGYEQTGDPDGNLDDETTIVLGPGDDELDADFGYNAPPLGSICGTVWEDVDGDGTQNNSEQGIEGVEMTLKDANGNVIKTTMTDANGDYCFEELPAGSYLVCADEPDGLDPTFDPDGTLDNETPVDLDPGENEVDVDFGYNSPSDPVCLANVDFETDSYGTELVAGQIIDDEFAGMTVTTMDPANHPAMIFDSSNPTGGDLDLGTPNQDFGGPGIGDGGGEGETGENAIARGKVLIISEDGDQTDPDDLGAGGTITITFDELVELSQVGILDIEEEGGTVVAYDADGNVLNTSPIAALGNNSVQTVLIPAVGVASLKVNFVSSGAITDIIFCADLCVYNWNGEGGRAFYMPGISTVLAFEPDAGSWQEFEGGIATITGEVTDQNAPGQQGFVVDVEASGRYVSGDLVYYADWSGTLTGTGHWEGAELEFEGTGDDFRIGYGGNLKDDDLGVSGWFNWTVTSQPNYGDPMPETGKGDINADVAGCDLIHVCTDDLNVHDSFDTQSYGNNNGTDDWASDWFEVDPEGQGAAGGQVLVTDGWLRLDDAPDSGSMPSVARTVDLSEFENGGSCELSFHWCTDAGVDADDAIALEISNDGGISYTVIQEFTGYEGFVQGHENIDISAYASANTTIRFTVTHTYGGDEEHFYIDDLDISCSCG